VTGQTRRVCEDKLRKREKEITNNIRDYTADSFGIIV